MLHVLWQAEGTSVARASTSLTIDTIAVVRWMVSLEQLQLWTLDRRAMGWGGVLRCADFRVCCMMARLIAFVLVCGSITARALVLRLLEPPEDLGKPSCSGVSAVFLWQDSEILPQYKASNS